VIERVPVGAGDVDLPQLALDPAAGLIEVRDLSLSKFLTQQGQELFETAGCVGSSVAR